MKPWLLIASARTRETELSLHRRGDEWVIRADGRPLMSSRQHGSEEALARLALEQVRHPKQVLIGGLGLGFTARAALDLLPAAATLCIAELTPALIEWNRIHLGACAHHPLDDPRVRAVPCDVLEQLEGHPRAWDAILLDVDNGPAAMVHSSNQRLYGPAGIAACVSALRPGGALAVWSAGPDASYLKRLAAAGLDAIAHVAPARGERGGARQVVFVARRPR